MPVDFNKISNMIRVPKRKGGINNMLNEKVKELLNLQVNKELASAYKYLDFSRYMQALGLPGFANWYAVQAKEEVDHAMLFFGYLEKENALIRLDTIDAPEMNDGSVIDVLTDGLEHEKYVTALINNIYDVAHSIKDYRTMKFLDWFITEQQEEEVNAMDLISKYELVSDGSGLYMLDEYLGKREYSKPSFKI